MPNSFLRDLKTGWRIILLAGIFLLAAAACSGAPVAPTPPAGSTALPSATTTSPAALAPTSTSSTATPAPTAPPVSPTPGPSTTPSPTVATAAPTGTASLATPSVSAPAPTSSAVASNYQVAQVFDKALRDYQGGFMGAVKHNYLGAPREAAHQTKMAEQAFGSYDTGGCSSTDSLFLWREDTKQINFLVVGNQGLHSDACREFWNVFADTWHAGEPNNDDLKAPAGYVVPHAGFGKLWREQFYGKSPLGLGFPKAPERYFTGTVQRFQNATAFYIPDTRAIYVLFDNFSYYTRSGVDTGRVWFRVE